MSLLTQEEKERILRITLSKTLQRIIKKIKKERIVIYYSDNHEDEFLFILRELPKIDNSFCLFDNPNVISKNCTVIVLPPNKISGKIINGIVNQKPNLKILAFTTKRLIGTLEQYQHEFFLTQDEIYMLTKAFKNVLKRKVKNAIKRLFLDDLALLAIKYSAISSYRECYELFEWGQNILDRLSTYYKDTIYKLNQLFIKVADEINHSLNKIIDTIIMKEKTKTLEITFDKSRQVCIEISFNRDHYYRSTSDSFVHIIQNSLVEYCLDDVNKLAYSIKVGRNLPIITLDAEFIRVYAEATNIPPPGLSRAFRTLETRIAIFLLLLASEISNDKINLATLMLAYILTCKQVNNTAYYLDTMSDLLSDLLAIPNFKARNIALSILNLMKREKFILTIDTLPDILHEIKDEIKFRLEML